MTSQLLKLTVMPQLLILISEWEKSFLFQNSVQILFWYLKIIQKENQEDVHLNMAAGD